jgi:hypothetical protein
VRDQPLDLVVGERDVVASAACSRCSTRLAPMIGAVTTGCRSSQASATCAGVSPISSATLATLSIVASEASS